MPVNSKIHYLNSIKSVLKYREKKIHHASKKINYINNSIYLEIETNPNKLFIDVLETAQIAGMIQDLKFNDILKFSTMVTKQPFLVSISKKKIVNYPNTTYKMRVDFSFLYKDKKCLIHNNLTPESALEMDQVDYILRQYCELNNMIYFGFSQKENSFGGLVDTKVENSYLNEEYDGELEKSNIDKKSKLKGRVPIINDEHLFFRALLKYLDVNY